MVVPLERPHVPPVQQLAEELVNRMGNTLPEASHETAGTNGFRVVSPKQTALNLRTFAEWREIVYAAVRAGVGKAYDKQSAFADDVGKSGSVVSKRLNHKPDDEGNDMLAPLDYLATLACAEEPYGLETALALMLKEKGYRIVPIEPPSEAEQKRALARELPEHRRRQVEREQGWPEGWIDQ